MNAATVRDIGPAEAWFCNCTDWGYGPNCEKDYTRVLRPPHLNKCEVCDMVAPWAEEVAT